MNDYPQQQAMPSTITNAHRTKSSIHSDNSSKVPVETSSSSNNANIRTNPSISNTIEISTMKPLMSDNHPSVNVDMFESFRRMAANIHHLFNAPYSKVINVTPSCAATTMAICDSTSANDKTVRTSSTNSTSKSMPTNNTFNKAWKIEHTAGD
jgi:hypothetical protein